MDSPNAIYGYSYGLADKTPLQDVCDRMQSDPKFAVDRANSRKVFGVFAAVLPVMIVLAYLYHTILMRYERERVYSYKWDHNQFA